MQEVLQELLSQFKKSWLLSFVAGALSALYIVWCINPAELHKYKSSLAKGGDLSSEIQETVLEIRLYKNYTNNKTVHFKPIRGLEVTSDNIDEIKADNSIYILSGFKEISIGDTLYYSPVRKGFVILPSKGFFYEVGKKQTFSGGK